MKINERTILNKGCRICEQEYLSLFPALAVSYYSNRKGLKAELMREKTYHLYLNEEERSRVIQSLIELKNNLAAQGRYTAVVDRRKQK